VGSNWGILGIAVGYSVGTALNWPFVLVWLRRVSSIEIRPLFFGGVRSILLGLLCVAAVQVLTNYAPSGDIPSIGLAVLMTFVVSVTIFAAVPIYRKDARAFLETSNLAFGRRASGVEKVG
jgi:PST family polysaccharide transporter